jgi:hypothetical protein
MMAARRGLFLSVMMPMGMPDAYMPRLAAVPYHYEWVISVGLQTSYDDIALGRAQLELIGELGCPCRVGILSLVS